MFRRTISLRMPCIHFHPKLEHNKQTGTGWWTAYIYMNCSVLFKLPLPLCICAALKALSRYNHSLVYFHLRQAASHSTREVQVQLPSKVYINLPNPCDVVVFYRTYFFTDILQIDALKYFYFITSINCIILYVTQEMSTGPYPDSVLSSSHTHTQFL